MHRLDLVMNGKGIVLNKVNKRNEDSSRSQLHHHFALVILPIGYKVVSHEILNLRHLVPHKISKDSFFEDFLDTFLRWDL